MAVNIKDVAARAGVSPATVSLALKNNPLVNANTRIRIKKIADEMGYTPNPYAQKLVNQKSGTIGLIIPDITNMFYSQLVEHCDKFVAELGYSLTIAMSDNSAKHEEEVISRMVANRVEAIMLAPVHVPANRDFIENVSVPIVYTTALQYDSRLPYVISNLGEGMRLIAEYAISRGHKSFLYLTGEIGVPTLDMREKGFVQAVNNLNYDIVRLTSVTYSSAVAYIRENIADIRKYDAVICVNDMMAVGVLNTFLSFGIKVPDEIAVSGYDDIIFSETAAIPITTVHQDIKKISEESVKLTLAVIRGDNSKGSDDRKIITQNTLVIRNSL